jgi:FAD/FMN-containing dehydrogenase
MSQIVTDLATLLPGKVILPSDETYTTLTASYFAQQSRLSPVCYVLPTSAEDVSIAVKMLAETPDAVFAIRGGGRSWVPGAANIDGGVTIDMRNLNHVDVDEEASTVSIGGGACLGDVHAVLSPRGLAIVGGRNETLGVGGFFTGGMSRTYPSSSMPNLSISC